MNRHNDGMTKQLKFCSFFGTHLTPIVSFHHKLVSSWDQSKSVGMIKLSSYVLSKCITSTTRRYSPPTAVIWIRPQKITHWPFMRNLLMQQETCQIAAIELQLLKPRSIHNLNFQQLPNARKAVMYAPLVCGPKLVYYPMYPTMVKALHASRRSAKYTPVRSS